MLPKWPLICYPTLAANTYLERKQIEKGQLSAGLGFAPLCFSILNCDLVMANRRCRNSCFLLAVLLFHLLQQLTQNLLLINRPSGQLVVEFYIYLEMNLDGLGIQCCSLPNIFGMILWMEGNLSPVGNYWKLLVPTNMKHRIELYQNYDGINQLPNSPKFLRRPQNILLTIVFLKWL